MAVSSCEALDAGAVGRQPPRRAQPARVALRPEQGIRSGSTARNVFLRFRSSSILTRPDVSHASARTEVRGPRGRTRRPRFAYRFLPVSTMVRTGGLHGEDDEGACQEPAERAGLESPGPRARHQRRPDRVLKTGVCGTDLPHLQLDAWAQKTIPVPLVVGHEFVGRVEQAGSNVTGFQPGISSARRHLVCGRCRNCMAGRRHLCPHTQAWASTGRAPSRTTSASDERSVGRGPAHSLTSGVLRSLGTPCTRRSASMSWGRRADHGRGPHRPDGDRRRAPRRRRYVVVTTRIRGDWSSPADGREPGGGPACESLGEVQRQLHMKEASTWAGDVRERGGPGEPAGQHVPRRADRLLGIPSGRRP